MKYAEYYYFLEDAMKNQIVFTSKTNQSRIQNNWINPIRTIITAILFLLISLSTVFAQEPISYGTGFFVSDDGLIVTCAHVLEEGSIYKVKMNGTEHAAKVIAKDDQTDLAVLKIDYKNQYYFKVSDFASTNPGDKIFVLGFPLTNYFGNRLTLTDGIVNALVGLKADSDYFQISAPIQPGNSGGPVFDANFNVVGVVSHGIDNIPLLEEKRMVPQVVNFGSKSSNISLILKNNNLGSGNVKTMNDAYQATVEVLNYPLTIPSGSSIRIENKTGYTILEVYIRPSGSINWGNDRLETSTLRDGQTATIQLPAGTTNRFDICIVDRDDDTYTKFNVAVTPNGTIEFLFEDIDLDWFRLFGF